MKILDLLTPYRLRPLVVVGIVTLLAFGLLAGSVIRLFRLNADLHHTREAVVRQQDHLGRLQEDLRTVATEGLEDRFRNFAAQLPEDAAGVRGWLTEVQCLASNRRLVVSPTWGDAEIISGSLGRFERIQVILEVRPDKDAGNAKTAAVVRWLRDLDLNQPPWELNRVHFSGTNQGLALAVVTGNLWIRASEPAAP
jgi:hypothetical protein